MSKEISDLALVPLVAIAKKDILAQRVLLSRLHFSKRNALQMSLYCCDSILRLGTMGRFAPIAINDSHYSKWNCRAGKNPNGIVRGPSVCFSGKTAIFTTSSFVRTLGSEQLHAKRDHGSPPLFMATLGTWSLVAVGVYSSASNWAGLRRCQS